MVDNVNMAPHQPYLDTFVNKAKPMYRLGQVGFAGYGALKGAQFGAQLDSPGQGVMIGAGIGAMALPVGLAVATKGSEAIGTGLFAAGRMAKSAGDAVFNKVGIDTPTSSDIGGAVIEKGPEMAKAGLGKVQNVINNYDGLFSNLYTFNPYPGDGEKMFSMTNKGKAMMVGASIIGGAREALSALERSRIGEIDPYVQTATPQLPSYTFNNQPSPGYVNNAGATGDLAFALSTNRRG